MTKWRETAVQASRYLVTGGIAAIVDIGGFALGLRAGLSIVVAAMISFLLAALVNYLLSSRYVFKQDRSRRGYLLFLAAASLGFLLNVSLTVFFSGYLLGSPILAKTLAIGIAFVFNFTLNKFIVFR